MTELAQKTGRLFFSVKMVNNLEIRPFLTLKGLTHGPKILVSKSYNVALDTPPPNFVAEALIGAYINGGGASYALSPPPDGVILKPFSSARVIREKSKYAGPDPTRPDPTRTHDAFEKLISLEGVNRFASGLLSSMSPFNKFRI